MISKIDHIQLAIPKGAEDTIRSFYEQLGFAEVPKPLPLQGRGGLWMKSGDVNLHFGVDPSFAPATKAHSAFVVSDLAALANSLTQVGVTVSWDRSLPDVARIFCF